MALLKEIDFKFGLKATYWACDQVNIGWYNNSTAHVELLGYISEDSKKKDKETHLMSYSYNVPMDVFTKVGNNEEEFYTWLKGEIAEELEKPKDERGEHFAIFEGYTDKK